MRRLRPGKSTRRRLSCSSCWSSCRKWQRLWPNPCLKTDRIVVISNGQNGSGTGASKVTQDVTNIIAQVPATVEALTGIDLLQAIGNLTGMKSPPVNSWLKWTQTMARKRRGVALRKLN